MRSPPENATASANFDAAEFFGRLKNSEKFQRDLERALVDLQPLLEKITQSRSAADGAQHAAEI